MEKIAVLLAVYNGREWIDEQLNSILQQKNVDLDVYISVDLSTDGSYEYLVANYSSYPQVTILPYGIRYGSAGKNFYRLVLDVNVEEYDFVSFADQDDIWNKKKLEQAINILTNNGFDAYSSNVVAFWDDGKKCLIDKAQPQVEYDYLFEAAGPGCTYVFNKDLCLNFQSFLLNYQNAKNIELHDWLLYAFARAGGFSWYIDKNAYMLYRQHSNNQVGANTNIKAAWKRIKLVKDGWYKNEILSLAEMFLSAPDCVYTALKENKLHHRLFLLKKVCSLRRRNRDRLVLFMLLFLNIL